MARESHHPAFCTSRCSCKTQPAPNPQAPSDQSEDQAGTRLPTELVTHALREHRALVAAEIARHLGNIESEVRRHREALAHYDHVFALRLTGATSGEPSAASTEGTPTA